VYVARSAKVGSPLGEECGAFRKPDGWFAGGDEDDGFDYDYGNGKWYSFRLERVLWIKNLG
jgi:hypothetical protein